VGCDFNLKRDEEKIRKYFRSFDELERKLEWVKEEINKIMNKTSFYNRSKEQQKRLDDLRVDKERLEIEFYYSRKFFIIC
jgi:septal ring factor EnvC (AmiA/AmiB activator)